MKQYDLCILLNDTNNYTKSTYVIIIELLEDKEYSLVELWNFKQYDGAEIDVINKNNLRLATKEEMQQYQIKFEEYCSRNQK